MPSALASAFDLPPRLAAKADPAAIADDERHFAAIAETLAAQIAETTRRLEETTLIAARDGELAMERDLEARRLASRISLLRRFTLDLCLGRIVPAEHSAPVYIGRLGLTSDDGERLLVDWRAPAAEPFFAATHGEPRGLASRRRYRWTGGRVSDYWDEVFTAEGLEHATALDDQSAFIASLGATRSPRMRDVLGTIQADQDAIVRAGSRGALVVDGGPGTGKTVVALHRAAYLLYADPLLAPGRGGVLFVGPSDAYLSYVDDVLPSLGEDSVQVRTLRDLVPEGAKARDEEEEDVAALKGAGDGERAIARAVRAYEQPPADDVLVETPWADVVLTAADWDEAFASPEPGTPHNEARDQVWQTLVDIVASRHDRDVPHDLVRRALAQSVDLTQRVARAWPLIDPAALVTALWSTPSFLARCAPWLDDEERRMLHRDADGAFTTSDLPVLDAARRLVGDPEASARRRRREKAAASRRAQMDLVVDDLIAADDSELKLMSMLRLDDARISMLDEAELPADVADVLAGPFAHVIVDEAQELTDAEWRMLLARCPSRSFTIVGDRAQARRGFAESWESRLARVGLRDARVASLTINYRTPEEVMEVAEPVIRAAIPDANVPTSIRRSGVPVRHAAPAELDGLLDDWLATHPEGTACVIGDTHVEERPRVRVLTPATAKGLEFDLVALVDPAAPGGGIRGAVDRYVSMTRATRELVIVEGGEPAHMP